MTSTKYISLQVRQWFMDFYRQQPTLNRGDIPVELRGPAIVNRYRALNQPWIYYLKSLFHIHNETVNVWTHLVGFVAIWVTLEESTKDFNLWTDKHSWPLLLVGTTSLFLCFASTLAHLLHSRSVYSHYTIFMFDYAGVSLYSYGCGIQTFYGSSDKKMYELLDGIYLPVHTIMTLINFFVLCSAKICYGQNPNNKNRQILCISTIGMQCIFGSITCIPRYYNCYYDDACYLSSLNHLTILWIIFIFCAVFFGSHYPERLFPGKCDVLGQGHQIFHVLITLNQILQLRAMKIDVQTGAVDHTDPKCVTLLLSFVFIVVSQVCIFIIFKDIVIRKYSYINKRS